MSLIIPFPYSNVRQNLLCFRVINWLYYTISIQQCEKKRTLLQSHKLIIFLKMGETRNASMACKFSFHTCSFKLTRQLLPPPIKSFISTSYRHLSTLFSVILFLAHGKNIFRFWAHLFLYLFDLSFMSAFQVWLWKEGYIVTVQWKARIKDWLDVLEVILGAV